MKCIYCLGKTTVTDTEKMKYKVFRRRKCQICNSIFCTEESVTEYMKWSDKAWRVRRGQEETE